MADLAKRIETAANVTIIIIATLIAVVFVQRYFFADHAQSVPQIAAGTKVSLPNAEWAKNKQTLLLVLQKDCHFCSESAAFYQRLVRETAESGNTHLIAVLPQKTDEGRNYLSDLGVAIDDVRQLSPAMLGARGTPTLILVNNDGAVVNSWAGKLPADEESKVLNYLQREAIAVK